MKIITALGNENFNKKLKEKYLKNVYGNDIQYQEAVIEIIEKNQDIDLLILSSILPGELNIYEFINLLKYKNSKMEIIIILEKKNVKIEEFIIAKGINNIYYNNSTNLNQIIEKINELENNENYKEKILNKIIEKNKIKYLINNLIKKIIKKTIK